MSKWVIGCSYTQSIPRYEPRTEHTQSISGSEQSKDTTPLISTCPS